MGVMCLMVMSGWLMPGVVVLHGGWGFLVGHGVLVHVVFVLMMLVIIHFLLY